MRRREQPLRPPSVSNPLRQISQIVIYAANLVYCAEGSSGFGAGGRTRTGMGLSPEGV